MTELQKVVLQFLTACERVGLAGQKVDLESTETIKLFAAVCESAEITPEDLRQALTPFLRSNKFFPKPAEMVEAAAPFRDSRQDQATSERLRKMFANQDAPRPALPEPERIARRERLMAEDDEASDGRQLSAGAKNVMLSVYGGQMPPREGGS